MFPTKSGHVLLSKIGTAAAIATLAVAGTGFITLDDAHGDEVTRTVRSYESAYFQTASGGLYSMEADKTTAAEASSDRYDFHFDFICYDNTPSSSTIYITLKYDSGSGFQTYSTFPVVLNNAGCVGSSTFGHYDFVGFVDGMGANTTFRVEVSDPGNDLFDFGGYSSYVDWNT